MSDEGSVGSGRPPEERELAGYLDELISAGLSQKESDAERLRAQPADAGQRLPPLSDAEQRLPQPAAARPHLAEEARPEKPPDTDVAGAGRASMREELLALFRDTERGAADSNSADAQSAPRAPAPGATLSPTHGEPAAGMTLREASIADATLGTSAAPAQSVFLQRFLRRAPCAADLPSSGITDLDVRLGGGLGPGLHVLAGPPGAGKTAFMISAVWEAVSARRPAVYYAFREGSLRAWMRLVATLASFQESRGDSALTLTRLRSGRLAPEQLESLGRLDRLLQASVLPLLSLVDTVPARVATLDAFAEDVRVRGREVSQKRGRVPLILVDDLDRLLLLASEQPLVHALALLDEVLREECVPGLVAANLTDSLIEAAGSLPVQTVLVLEEAVGKLEEGFGRTDLHVRASAPTGWKGTLPLLLDVSSGLFAFDPTTPQRAQERAPSNLAPTPPPSLPFSC